ncbi:MULTISPECIES: LLM class flavin-dependent oxidoreductase [Flavobacterium]|uniref:LLM class flavin-dependent oxidoreductase n=1 Tax=Flavobacterium lipolyticum TaxID=2893754 RepID=A0ABS8M3W5_9FLAO|nr:MULTISPECIES: LLM class flavin-dependent oxidoreductase [unclassified Flavobacterium]MCC9019510.1 LLM class flavin-dependent oxidoreductase [Flavobacterium sp. F-126]
MEIGIDTFVSSGGGTIVERDERAIENLLERIKFADELGFDLYGIGEHHGKDKLDSAPVVLMAAAASITNRIRITSAVTGLSTVDPVRLFQEFATLDLVSKGRAEIIAGRGASLDAFPLFGLNIKDSAELFTEKLELLLKIRDNDTITWSGKFRPSLDNVSVYPRPLQASLPIWHAALRTPASFIRAGELGLPLMVAIIDGQIDQIIPLVELYREAGEDAGFSKDQLKVGLHSMGYVANTTEEAIKDFYPGWSNSMSKMHGLPKSLSRFEIDLKSTGSALLVGNPEEVAAKILHLSEALGGISRFCFQLDYASLPHEKLLQCIEVIGNKVIPIVKQESPVIY